MGVHLNRCLVDAESVFRGYQDLFDVYAADHTLLQARQQPDAAVYALLRSEPIVEQLVTGGLADARLRGQAASVLMDTLQRGGAAASQGE